MRSHFGPQKYNHEVNHEVNHEPPLN